MENTEFYFQIDFFFQQRTFNSLLLFLIIKGMYIPNIDVKKDNTEGDRVEYKTLIPPCSALFL